MKPAKRLPSQLFQLGPFENPYVNADLATSVIGKDEHRAIGMDVQRKSIVLLQNQDQSVGKTLPISTTAKVYTMGNCDIGHQAHQHRYQWRRRVAMVWYRPRVTLAMWLAARPLPVSTVP